MWSHSSKGWLWYSGFCTLVGMELGAGFFFFFERWRTVPNSNLFTKIFKKLLEVRGQMKSPISLIAALHSTEIKDNIKDNILTKDIGGHWTPVALSVYSPYLDLGLISINRVVHYS